MQSYAMASVFMAGFGCGFVVESMVLDLKFCMCQSELPRSEIFECGLGWWPICWSVREVNEVCLFECWVAVAIIFWVREVWQWTQTCKRKWNNYIQHKQIVRLSRKGEGEEGEGGENKHNTATMCQWHALVLEMVWEKCVGIASFICVPIWII